jgi:antitoxin YefM
MTIETNYTQARENLANLFDRVVDDAEIVVVRRRGKGQSRNRDVAIIAAEELESLLETAYLLRSPKNAERLLSALARAQAQTTPPSSIEDLRKEMGLTPEGTA